MSREWVDTDAEADAVGRDEDAWWNERDALADHPREDNRVRHEDYCVGDGCWACQWIAGRAS